ncbi:helix-turn-helix domain-containing protein [Nonomuraea sp. NPDC046802]|uniref:TetR/AcrR family transcriptional regulator n=1 Tax=Nonomuraea sp. NPDC046802 TaxID=3154919 RepID=UPI0033D54F18
MPEVQGLRARKKERTRHAMIEAALRLFDERGYEETTVAQIARAADMAPSTFFLHFASKDDVLFAEQHSHLDLASQAIRERSLDDTPATVLVRAFERVIAEERALLDRAAENERRRLRLLLSVPELRAQTLHKIMDAQQAIAAELQAAYPNQLDPIEAATMVGAMSGAVISATIAAFDAELDGDQLEKAVRRALTRASHGFTQVNWRPDIAST